MKHHLKYLFTGIIILLLLAVLVPTRAEAFSDTIIINAGEYKHYELYGFHEDDTLELEVREVDGIAIDVYILSDERNSPAGKSEFEKYRDGEYFDASFQRENTAEVKDVDWEVPDNDGYVLVIDNKDNAHGGDANSGQAVTVYIDYNEKDPEFDLQETLLVCGLCCILPVVVIIAIVVYRQRQDPYSSRNFPFMGRSPPWSGRQQAPPAHPQYPGYRQPPGPGPSYPQQPPRPPQQGGYGRHPSYHSSYSLKDMKSKTEGRSSLPKPPAPRPSSPPLPPPPPLRPPPLPSSSPPSPYHISEPFTETEPATPPEEKTREDREERYVIVQNIGEYVSGSKLNIHDSVVQRTSLGSTGSREEELVGEIMPGAEEEEYPIPDFDSRSDYETRTFYESILKKAWEDGYVNESEFRMLKAIRNSERITLDEHREIEKDIVEEKGATPMRCPECGGIGEYVVEKRGYYCPKCRHDI